MRYTLLGRTGLRVSELALGTMTFGTDWGWGADRETSQAIFERYAAAGGNFIDTSCNYTDGTSERFVGESIAGERDRYVVATKYTLRFANGNLRNLNEGGNSRKALMRTVEGSLERLNTDYVDLLYLHMWDFTTPVEEFMRGVDDLLRAGKVLYAGFSDTPAWVVSRAVALAERHGWAAPAAVQFPYSVGSRDPERELLPMARSLGLSSCVWGVLKGGGLSGKYPDPEEEAEAESAADDEARRYPRVSAEVHSMALELQKIARELSERHGKARSASQVAVNWVRQQPGVIPILGARTVAQIEDNLGALDFTLGEEEMARLNALSDFRRGFPLDFLTSGGVRELIFGDSFALIDNPRQVAGL